MAFTTTIRLTVNNPIPEWKGVDDLPDILTTSGVPYPISGGPEPLIDFHCAETIAKDAKVNDSNPEPEVVKFQLIEGTKYDDQS
jgi:hypothetical protein